MSKKCRGERFQVAHRSSAPLISSMLCSFTLSKKHNILRHTLLYRKDMFPDDIHGIMSITKCCLRRQRYQVYNRKLPPDATMIMLHVVGRPEVER